MSNSYCTAEVQDSWCNALNSLDENGLEYQPAAEFKCQTTQQLYQQEKDTFLHLPICTFPLRQSMSSIQQHINAQMIYRPAGAVPQQEDLLAAGAVWVCCRWYRRVCGVCWAVHLWNEQRCICNQGSPTKPNLRPRHKTTRADTSTVKTKAAKKIPRHDHTLIHRKRENDKSKLNVHSQQNLSWDYIVVYRMFSELLLKKRFCLYPTII